MRRISAAVILAAATYLATPPILATALGTRRLTFEERVRAQEAIERVYYSHQIGAKRSFEEGVRRDVIERKVRTYLGQSRALADHWGTPITAGMLREELARIIRHTRFPDRLREIFEALDNESYLIQETFVRTTLADRLAREFTAGQTPGPDEEILSPEISAASDEGWIAMTTSGTPVARVFHSAVWTGNYLIIWGGADFDPVTHFSNFLNSGGRYDPLTDSWTPTPITNILSPRVYHTAVWTGSEMIVWGGQDASGNFPAANPGGRYDPLGNTWTATSRVNAPAGRGRHTAIWTGSEMIIWGGFDPITEGRFSTGGSYDPVSDTWSSTSLQNAPQRRFGHTAVWTGSRMLVWGGEAATLLNTGGSYDPSSDSWETLPTAQVPLARSEHTAVWTGSEMIIWGGRLGTTNTDTGGAFDPDSFSWRPISTINVPSARHDAAAVWTGERMIVWGGGIGPGPVDSGGRYDPGSDCWAPTASTNALAGRSLHIAVWTGQEMIVWGGKTGSIFQNTGARYLPGSADACGGQANQPPVAVAGADQSFECASQQGTSVLLDGTLSTDLDGDPLTYTWTGPFPEGGGLVEGANPTVSLPLGTSIITLTVDDGHGHSGTDDVTITVQDTVAPALSVVANPATLWPPNHQMVPVRMAAAAQDLCDARPSVALISVISSEPEEAPGERDGNAANDIQGVSEGSADFEFDLRAERNGEGEGRIYSIVYRAVDASGNTVERTTLALVPHDRRGIVEPAGVAPRVEAPRRAVLLSGRCSLTIRARGAPPHLRPGSSRPG